MPRRPCVSAGSTLRNMRRGLEGWRSTHGRGADGSIRSDERVTAAQLVVERSERGAQQLGRRYWREIERASRGVVRPRATPEGIEVRLFGRGPSLLQFGPAETACDHDRVSCRYPIRGGLLTQRPGGAICLSQTGRDQPELRAAVTSFVPRLGLLYERAQYRLHVELSRRYFRSLIDGVRR
jgi:hypothetical protein